MRVLVSSIAISVLAACNSHSTQNTALCEERDRIVSDFVELGADFEPDHVVTVSFQGFPAPLAHETLQTELCDVIAIDLVVREELVAELNDGFYDTSSRLTALERLPDERAFVWGRANQVGDSDLLSVTRRMYLVRRQARMEIELGVRRRTTTHTADTALARYQLMPLSD